MNSTPLKALVIGATGATGKDLLQVLLADPDYSEVVAFVRRATGLQHPKLREVLTDFSKPEAVKHEISGDVFFSALGTTLKDAGSKEAQWKIDHDMPANFARLAATAGVKTAVLVSAYGASAKSRVFYSRMKGALEDAIAATGFASYIIFRPGMLDRLNTDRPAERFTAGALRFLNKLGLLRRYRPLPTRLLAEKLALAPKKLGKGRHVISLAEIFDFG